MGLEVRHDLAKDLFATFVDVSPGDRRDVFFHQRSRQPQLGCRPFAKQLVAARLCFEFEFLIERELLLEGSLALFECCHVSSPPDPSSALGQSPHFVAYESRPSRVPCFAKCLKRLVFPTHVRSW